MVEAESISELLRRARAARDGSALDTGRSLSERAWARAAEHGSAAERAEAGHLLCLFHHRLGAHDALLDVGAPVLRLLDGAEFLVVFADMPAAQALEVCERLRLRVEGHHWTTLAAGLQVTPSVGLAHAPPHELAPLFEEADRAMYSAKQGGRNRVAVA
jgi:predicted signal transduction protein with EAL and GGDEF domain